jgi:hypothetical protein
MRLLHDGDRVLRAGHQGRILASRNYILAHRTDIDQRALTPADSEASIAAVLPAGQHHRARHSVPHDHDHSHGAPAGSEDADAKVPERHGDLLVPALATGRWSQTRCAACGALLGEANTQGDAKLLKHALRPATVAEGPSAAAAAPSAAQSAAFLLRHTVESFVAETLAALSDARAIFRFRLEAGAPTETAVQVTVLERRTRVKRVAEGAAPPQCTCEAKDENHTTACAVSSMDPVMKVSAGCAASSAARGDNPCEKMLKSSPWFADKLAARARAVR